jgi:predicted amidohydrolase
MLGVSDGGAMRVTVCELPDARKPFEAAWDELVEHVHEANSGLVVLPDMPFHPWLTGSECFDFIAWREAVQAHDRWERKLHELSPAVVIASRPVDFGNERYDEGFVWEETTGILSVHATPCPPDGRGPDKSPATQSTGIPGATELAPIEVRGLRLAILLGHELWAAWDDEAGTCDVCCIPRSGDKAPLADTLKRARVLAQHAGVYSLSSNRSGTFGGHAWIISPEGNVLGLTCADQPFLSMEIALYATHEENRHFDVFAQ